jgi:hypothetical protein
MKQFFVDGGQHAMLGRNHSDGSKLKMSESHRGKKATPAQRLVHSQINRGVLNPFYGRTHTPEARLKLSRSLRSSTKLKRGKDCIFWGRIFHAQGLWYSRKDGQQVWLRSSYEVAVAKWLDAQSLTWQYEPKAFPVIFNLNGQKIESTYTPDFYVVEYGYYIEVKGYWHEDAKLKFIETLVQNQDLKVEVWQLPKLKELGIL